MKVKELSDETKWTKEEMTRGSDGSYCDERSEKAVCWCLLRAIRKCYNLNIGNRIISSINEKTSFWGLTSVTTWNDAKERTFADVKALVEELDI